ncbi:MAG: hypothetical protein Q9181_005855 [Wetmoreana brouardii]
MFRRPRPIRSLRPTLPIARIRPASIATLSPSTPKPVGDISSVFPSLSGTPSPPLPSRFADVKKRLIHDHESQLQESWRELLAVLLLKREWIKESRSDVIPEINFNDLNDVVERTDFRDALHTAGVAVIRGVVSEKEALDWKELVQRYIRTNPGTRGFPSKSPAVYELYWSPSQILARAHQNLLKAQAFLMSHWRSAPTADSNGNRTLISTSHPVSYADRLRIRQPGDSGFALGPHIDGGSCERWEEDGYGRGGVYNAVFEGNWTNYDPWEMTCRIPVQSDLYTSPGGCSMFRMFQGWLAMSETGAGEGHLMVCPALKEATAYFLLRPFFSPKKTFDHPDYLEPDNWTLEDPLTSNLQGAVPGNGQELNSILHPHLSLRDTMVHVPRVQPGDYVAWHCDTIHAVDNIHTGTADSSVMYIPACPLTELNAEYLARQRDAFADGTPAPDFPSSDEGENQHRGRLTPEFVMKNISVEAQRAMGLAAFDMERRDMLEQERVVLRRANEILGFTGT